jgi:hypothetical protein
MYEKAHVRAHPRARTQTHADRHARTNSLSARLAGREQLIARWVPSANGNPEIRWEPRVRFRTLMARSSGRVMARRS